MTVTHPSARPAREAPARKVASDEDPALGALVAELKGDLGRLVGEQLAIAKIEMKREGGKAGKGAGLLGAAAFAGYMVAMFASLAAVYGLGHLIGNGWAALVVTGFWALVAALTALLGRATLRKITGPQQTIAAFKENLEWARSLKK